MMYDVYFFFFQAEDGIRDGRVTGVQTCALPICRADRASKRWIYFFGEGGAEGNAGMRDLLGGKGAGLAEMVRSEERRVGKECRSWWWAYHSKKKESGAGSENSDRASGERRLVLQ